MHTDRKHSQSIRLKGYDYSQPGFYYVTICTQDRIERFGDVLDAEMVFNDAGEMVDDQWNRIRKYIMNNPKNWVEDENNLENFENKNVADS